jgi:hypothetical protein
MRSSSTDLEFRADLRRNDPLMFMATATCVAAFIFVAVAVGFLGGTL